MLKVSETPSVRGENDAPSDVVRSLDVTEDDGVTHGTVLVGVVDLGATRPLTTLLGASEELVEAGQVLLDSRIAVLRGNDGAALLLDSLAIGVVHEHVTLLDELLSVLDDLVKVVRGVGDLVVGDVDHLEVLLDRRLELALLLEGVRVVEAKDVGALVLVCEEAVEDSGLQVANVEVSRWLGGETKDDLAWDSIGEDDFHALGTLLLLELLSLLLRIVHRVDSGDAERKSLDVGPPTGQVGPSGLLDRTDSRDVGCGEIMLTVWEMEASTYSGWYPR